MVQVTGTNHDLLDALYGGELTEEIPKMLRRPERMQGIADVLEAAWTTTLGRAILLFSTYKILSYAYRVIAKIIIVVSAIFLVFAIWIGNIFIKEVDGGIASFSDGFISSFKSKVAKNSANLWYEKRKAEKKAQFEANQATKAINYNPNSYEAQKRFNYAKNAAFEAKKASDNYYQNR
jgi:hypothetical protein